MRGAEKEFVKNKNKTQANLMEFRESEGLLRASA